jgi:hypothetical protein
MNHANTMYAVGQSRHVRAAATVIGVNQASRVPAADEARLPTMPRAGCAGSVDPERTNVPVGVATIAMSAAHANK